MMGERTWAVQYPGFMELKILVLFYEKGYRLNSGRFLEWFLFFSSVFGEVGTRIPILSIPALLAIGQV